MRILTVAVERFPIAGTFTIARGSKTEAVVVTATITDGARSGRGECVPYAHYGETVEGVVAKITEQAVAIGGGINRNDLQRLMPAGAARNAVDCALWDLDAKVNGQTVCELAGIAAHRPLLKVKLGGAGDVERIAAVRAAAPNARLIVDANEAWTPEQFDIYVQACAAAGVEVIEQPLPAGRDEALARLPRTVPICADESVHDSRRVAELVGRYDAINIKLDKTGGLTEALILASRAKQLGLGIMVGCMVGTSLAMAPAMLLTLGAKWVDLDGPLLLRADRPGGLRYDGSVVHPAERGLWG